MTLTGCVRSDEVREIVRLGHWPVACAEELRAHVAVCDRCSDLIVVTQHLQRARRKTMPAVAPAGANLLWLRAQAKRRQAALERSGRPVAIAQIFALAIAVVAAMAIAVVMARSAFEGHTVSSAVRPFAAALSSFAAGSWGMELLAGAGLLLVFGGAAVLLAGDPRK